WKLTVFAEIVLYFFFQAEDGIRDLIVTGVQTCALPICLYAGFHEMRRRLAAARPDLLVMFVNDHLQNFPYSNLPAFCVGLVDARSEERRVGKARRSRWRPSR